MQKSKIAGKEGRKHRLYIEVQNVKSTDQIDTKSSTGETPPANPPDPKSLKKKLSREELQFRKKMLRELKLLRRLEEKERERLEEGEWSNNRTTMLGKYPTIRRRALPLKERQRPNLGATGLGKEIKIGTPSSMPKKKKGDPVLLADLKVIEVISVEQKRLIGLLDLLESVEKRHRKRLEEIPW
jgi:hypothetical protein